MKMPTLISYSLAIEQEITPNTSLTISYVGSHGYHELIGVDANAPFPTICPASPCPASIPLISRRRWRARRFQPARFYIPAGTPKANPALANTWTWFSVGDSSYNALQLDFNHRFSHDLSFRAVYTWSKALDDGDSLNQTTAGNAPGLVANPYDIKADWGLATYDVRNLAAISAVYALALRQRKEVCRDLRAFRIRAERLVGEQHRYAAVRIPLYAATQLQPFQQWRYTQSSAAICEP